MTREALFDTLCPNPLPVKHSVTIQDGGIKHLVYREYRYKITQASTHGMTISCTLLMVCLPTMIMTSC